MPKMIMNNGYTATIFEFIVTRELEVGKFLPVLHNFENDDQYMDYLLDSSLPKIDDL